MQSEGIEAGGTSRLVWVRHAHCEGEGLFLGQSDAPLSTQGRRQLPRLVRKLSQYQAQTVYASDLRRTLATAAAISRSLGIEVEPRPGLREIRFGRWEGLSWKQITERFPRPARGWMKYFPRRPIPEGEDFRKFKGRVRRELLRMIAAHPGGCAIVVTHAGVIRVTLANALGMPDKYLFRIAQDFGALTVIDYFPGGAIVRCANG
jgi:alpha-ribazole phosphatase